MKKLKGIRKRIMSLLVVLVMAMTMVVPSITANAVAVEDNIDLGEASLNAATNVMTYNAAVGYGSTLYKSIVVSFTSIRKNSEKIILPTIDGFVNEDSLSNDATYVINIPDGKTLPQIAAYIRKMQFVNCQNSTNTIKFTVGKEEVKYKTSYCEATGHYYQFVPFDGANGKTLNSYQSLTLPDGTTVSAKYGWWYYAYYYSLTQEYEGLQGYLVSINKLEEDAFLYKNMKEIGWIGGTRIAPDTTTYRTSKGVNYFTTFLDVSSAYSYWYWAAGPKTTTTGGSKFLSYQTGSDTRFQSDYTSYGYYNNWNSGEPNNSGGEYCATTLQWGYGYETCGRSGRVSSTSEYYIAGVDFSTTSDGVAWNDMAPSACRLSTSAKTQYQPDGFYIEYGYSDTVAATDKSQGFTGFVFNKTTVPHTHTWQNTVSETDPATAEAYCTTVNESGGNKCSYYGSASSHANTFDVTLIASDMAQNAASTYTGASLPNGTTYKTATGATITNIAYYKVGSAGVTTGGTSMTAAEVISTIGYYYATVTCTVNGTTATLVAPFKIYDPNGSITEETLNNRKSTLISDGGLTELENTKIVTSTTDTSDLDIVYATSGDSIAVYKIGEGSWTGSTFNGVSWVSRVQKWIDNSSTYSSIASTPSANSKESGGNSATWASLYKAMFGDTDNVLTAYTGDGTTDDPNIAALTPIYSNRTGYTADASQTDYASSSIKYVTSDNSIVDTSDGNTLYGVRLNTIKSGIYAILGTNGSEQYAITVAAVYPQQTGPNNTYYMSTLYTVYLKETEATIDKTINGLKEDTVAIGETETFEVKFQLPKSADRAFAASTGTTVSGYTLSFEDIMASGFTINESSLKVYAYYTAGTGSDQYTQKVLLYDANDSTVTIPTSQPYKFFTTEVADSLVVSKTSDNKYVINKGESTQEVVTTNSAMENMYAYKRAATAIFTTPVITKSNVTNTSTDDDTTKITFSFDEPAVRQYVKDVKAGNGKDGKGTAIGAVDILGYVVEYTAETDPDIKIASEENSNKAIIHHEKSNLEPNVIVDLDDTVYGYTYGAKVVKIDGSADGATSYLAGAKFKLYKEIASYTLDGSTYTFAGDIYMDTTDPLLNVSLDGTETGTKYTTETDLIAALKSNSQYYVYEMDAPTGGYTTNAYDALKKTNADDTATILETYKTNLATNATNKNNAIAVDATSLPKVTYAAGAKVVRLYKEVAYESEGTSADSKVTFMAKDTNLGNGVITSVASADGVTVKGLDTGSYIMSEVAAPSGYNDLAEDIYFEINKLTQAEEALNSPYTLEYFREMEAAAGDYDPEDATTAVINTVGAVDLQVYNYKGLTLPSTGGIGIIIFIIIGCSLMAGVIILMVVKRRNDSVVQNS